MLLGLFGAVQAGCGGEVEKSPVLIRPVRFQKVIATGAQRERSFSDSARAGLESQLGFRVGGTVESVSAVVGATVKRGQEIARLDATDLRLSLLEAEASLAQALASKRKADADYDGTRACTRTRMPPRATSTPPAPRPS